MIQKKKPDVDVILDVLNETLAAYPASTFVASLLQQYQERGGLSRKQLEGLHGKASKVKSIAPGKLATLEAIMLKKNQKHRSEIPQNIAPVYEKNMATGLVIAAILQKYPEHKRVLFFKNKYDHNELLTPADISELEKFYKLLVVGKS